MSNSENIEGIDEKYILSPEKLRTFKGFENMQDEEIHNAINLLAKLSHIFYETFIENEY